MKDFDDVLRVICLVMEGIYCFQYAGATRKKQLPEEKRPNIVGYIILIVLGTVCEVFAVLFVTGILSM